MAEQPTIKKILRVPPQSIDAEMAFLGAIMLRPEALNEVLDLVLPATFYVSKHATIYKTMLELFGKSRPIDLLSLSSRLKELGQLETIGGMTYLTELVNSTPSAGNIRHYGEIVQKKHLLRRLIEASDHISELGYNESGDVEEVLDSAERRIFDVTNLSRTKSFIDLKDALGEAWERLERLHNSKGEIRGIPTGFRELDNLLAGFQKSDLIILAARPSMGKTSLALDIARQTSVNHNTPVCIFSLEMSSQQLVDRMLAAQARVSAWHLRTGRLSTDEEFNKIRDSLDRLAGAPIFIDDQPGSNILRMKSVARRLKSEKNLGLIVVDYLQLMVPTASRSFDSLVQQVTEISRSLKHLARELDIPVLALSQLSRAVEQRGGRPRLSDLRDSGCLSGETLLIRADTGERIPIKSLVGKTDIPVLSLDQNYNLRSMLISKVFSTGRKKLYELISRSGRRLKATANHKFLTLSGWRRLDQMPAGTRFAAPRAVGVKNIRDHLSEGEIILLAHLLGDGCVLPRQPIHYTSADKENLNTVSLAAKNLFGIKSRLVKQKNWWHLYLPSPYRLTRGKHHPITNWFKKLGINLVRAPWKRVPEVVFQESEEHIKLFLRHLWATDGNISWKLLQNRNRSAAIYYASSSRQLADDVQHLLLRLGIWSVLRIVSQKDYRPMYQIHIQGAPIQLSFLQKVGCFGKRGKVIPELIVALQRLEPNPNTDTIPKEVWQLFVTPVKEKVGASWRDLATQMKISYSGSAIFASGLSRERLSKVADALSNKSLLHLAESDVYWDEVVEVNPLGIEEVYDATVPNSHNLVAGDFIVHNSIEQDADVVMFIHREDKYKEDSAKPNIAEILIEKHRNGPTGKIELYFDDNKASFISLDKSDFGDFNSPESKTNSAEPF